MDQALFAVIFVTLVFRVICFCIVYFDLMNTKFTLGLYFFFLKRIIRPQPSRSPLKHDPAC